jgi:hypothetical protein
VPRPKPDDRARGTTPYWCTPDRVDALCVMLSKGITITHACSGLGINRSEFYAWKNADDDFRCRVNAALGEYENSLLARIDAAGNQPKEWKALTWLLEKRFPKKYGDRKRVELTGKNGQPLRVHASVDIIERVKRAIAAAEQDDGES